MRSRDKALGRACSRHTVEYDVGSAGIRAASSQGVNIRKIVLTHEQIAERAKALWLASGCVPGRDEQNWHEAETQLQAELKSC